MHVHESLNNFSVLEKLFEVGMQKYVQLIFHSFFYSSLQLQYTYRTFRCRWSHLNIPTVWQDFTELGRPVFLFSCL